MFTHLTHKTSNTSDAPVTSWDVEQVLMWATKHKLRLNLNKLKEEGITGATLLLLEAPDLAELGVPSGLQRKKVLAAIEQLAASTASADTVSMRSHTEMADGRNEL